MSSLPKTYKAVVIPEANAPFKLQDVDIQHPGPGTVLVKVKACGVCFSDVGTVSGHMGNVFPRVPGHEIVGDVVAVGEGVTRFKGGERVGGPWHGGHDGQCRACQRAQFQMCDNEQINGVTRDGGFAEYVVLRAEAVVQVPKDMDPAEAAPLLCAGVTVFNGLRKAHVEQGNLVAVQGLGGLGHLAVQYAYKMGYEVAVLSSGDDKAAFAKELGAHHYINTKTQDAAQELMKLGGAAVVLQTAPSPKAVTELVGGLAPAGQLINLAPVGNAEVNTVALVLKGASVQGWPSGHALDCEEAIRFAMNHNVKCYIEKYPLAKVQEAVDSLVAGKPRFRNVLIMD
ncbi:Alcohol dehydrogenase-like protein [Emericellopsis cladophorae]|uniref:Alcohol dehydrogenase-like protein n=1 Tax=Emericellopsis cladophorae TaxID=2686198 RepID=A0A9P9Y6P5_9HYPO|nr:Alcohol dehydrogenase-like protein [Emericellopsis cladophorae]KAI6784588.1 Alcohol dehydrogenase-like protein [Emericellopsis cladophorae]